MLIHKILIVAAAAASSVIAAPSADNGRPNAITPRSVTLPGFFAPPTVFDTNVDQSFSDGPSLLSFSALSPEDIAKAYIAAKTSGSVENLKVTKSVYNEQNGITSVYLSEVRDGIEVMNLASNVNVQSDGTILSAGHSNIPTGDLQPATAPSGFASLFRRGPYTASDAVVAAAKALGHSTWGLEYRLRARDGAVTGAPASFTDGKDIPTEIKYVLTKDGKLEKVWAVTVEQDRFWGQMLISVDTNLPIAAINYVADSFFDADSVAAEFEQFFEDEEPTEDDEAEFDEEEDLTGTTKTVLPRTRTIKTPQSLRTHTVRTPASLRTHTIKTPQSLRTHTIKTPQSLRTHTVRKTRTKKTRVTTTTAVASQTSVFTSNPTSTPTSTISTSTLTTTSIPTLTLTTTTRVSTTATGTLLPPRPIPPPFLTFFPTATFTTTPPVPTIRAVPYTEESMASGQQLFSDPALLDSSPIGWFDNRQIGNELVTSGNNLRAARLGSLGKSRRGGKFDYVYDPLADPTTEENIAAAITNTFFISNLYHDLLYRFGFTESAANFQYDNFGKGGRGNDGISAFVQSGDGLNNANFGTPPDGGAGRMRMYIFDRTTPRRDSDLDNGVIIHELTHGLSNRLTGGGTGACLQTLESAGMGEGWSDVLAWWATIKVTDDRNSIRALGLYLLNNTSGVRAFPYATSFSVNPLLYSSVANFTGVHAVGTVWSTMLYEVYWNMVESAGFNTDIFNAGSDKGNTRFLWNVVDGLKLQPCFPTFITSRDAILQADKVSGERFRCEIWRGFAKRGLGVGAAPYVDSFALPEGC